MAVIQSTGRIGITFTLLNCQNCPNHDLSSIVTHLHCLHMKGLKSISYGVSPSIPVCLVIFWLFS